MKQKKQNKFFKMKASADGKSGDVFLYGEITSYAWTEDGEHSAQTFKNELDALGNVEQINLFCNSPGGSVFEGIAIGNMLKRHKAHVTAYVEGVAASIASVIVSSADTVKIPKNAMLMVHNALVGITGNASELRKMADDLERINNSAKQTYLEKAGTKLTDEKIQKLMDDETWLSADEAYEYGLCDVVENANEMVACVNVEFLQKYKNVPTQLQNKHNQTMTAEEKTLRQKISDEAKASSEITNHILGGIYS